MRICFLIFAMSHHRTNLWYSSVNSKKKKEIKISEIIDPLYFLKDPNSHYIIYAFIFQKSKNTKIKIGFFLLPICQMDKPILRGT